MRTYRFVSSADTFPSPAVGSTATYPNTGAGSIVDAPEIDAPALRSCGFAQLMACGPTSARPNHGDALQAHLRHYFDTDLGMVICFDGRAWRDPSTGATV